MGEAACGRWAIGQNRRFLWSTQLWWLCDCKDIREILEYNGPISMMIRWAQELLGYHFSILHRSASVMIDADDLTRYFGSVVALHLCVTAILHTLNQKKRPAAYGVEFFDSPALKKIVPSILMMHQTITVLTTAVVNTCCNETVDSHSTALVTSPHHPPPIVSPSI